MPNDFSVFISHRAEDRFLARLWKALARISQQPDDQRSLECFVCEEISAARNGGNG